MASTITDSELSLLTSWTKKATSSSAMAERPRELSDFKKTRVNGVPALESWRPPNTNVRPPVYRPQGTGVFPPALSSPVMTNCPQVGVVKVT